MPTPATHAALLLVPLVGLPVGCAPPRAERIEGPIADCLERGRAAGDGSFGHAALTDLLTAFVDDDGYVDYDGLRGRRDDLDVYLESLAAVDLCGLPAEQQYALFLNAYNALTLRTILNGPADLESIRDLDDPWGAARHVIGGYTLSLDDIEHRILRPWFDDARIHFAVNCASVGCPPLRRRAFEADSLDEQLDQATSDALSRPRYLQVDGDEVAVTRLLDWYGEDFERHEGGVSAFLREFGGDPARAAIPADAEPDLRYLDYDWSLNDRGGR